MVELREVGRCLIGMCRYFRDRRETSTIFSRIYTAFRMVRFLQLCPMSLAAENHGTGRHGQKLTLWFLLDTGIVPNIPFKHAACTLPSCLDGEELLRIYKDLLTTAGIDETDYSHNLVMVKGWMLVLPRSRASQEGVKIVNAASMVGMIWVASEDVFDVWFHSADPMQILSKFGKPW